MKSRQPRNSSDKTDPIEWAGQLIPGFFSISMIAVISIALQRGIENALFLPYVGRRFGIEILGAFVLAKYWLMIPIEFVTISISNIYLRNKRLLSEAKDRYKLFGGLFNAGFIIVLLLLGVLWLIGGLDLQVVIDRPTQRMLIDLLGFGLLYYLVVLSFSFLRGELKLRNVYVVRSIIGALFLLIFPLSNILGQSSVTLVPILGLAVAFIILLPSLPLRQLIPNWLSGRAMRDHIAQGSLLGLPSILILIGRGIDRGVIGSFLGSSSVGLYFALTVVPHFLLLISEAIANVLFPYLVDHRDVGSGRRLWKWLWVSGFAIVGAGLILGIFGGEFFTDLLFGQGTYISGPSVFWIVFIGFAGGVPGILFRPYLVAYHKPSTLALINFFSLIITAVISILIIGRTQLLGVAVARAIGEWVRGVLTVLTAARGVKKLKALDLRNIERTL